MMFPMIVQEVSRCHEDGFPIEPGNEAGPLDDLKTCCILVMIASSLMIVSSTLDSRGRKIWQLRRMTRHQRGTRQLPLHRDGAASANGRHALASS
jgi:hypothetical protein